MIFDGGRENKTCLADCYASLPQSAALTAPSSEGAFRRVTDKNRRGEHRSSSILHHFNRRTANARLYGSAIVSLPKAFPLRGRCPVRTLGG